MKNKKYLIIIGVVLVIFSILGALLYNGYIWFVYPDRDKYNIKGIDVSHHQGDIAWSQVPADYKFVYIKSTEGDDWVDKKFEENYEEAKKTHMEVGAYHFYSLRIDGLSQAKNFINVVPLDTEDLTPVVDLEFDGNSKVRPSEEEFKKELDIYIAEIKNHYGVEPILYTTNEFYDMYLKNNYSDKEYWIRDIIKEPKSFQSDWIYWQYSNRGNVEGIEGFVDLNVRK